jgi:hypothetical protein
MLSNFQRTVVLKFYSASASYGLPLNISNDKFSIQTTDLKTF